MNSRRDAELVDVFVQCSLAAGDTRDRARPDSRLAERCLYLHGILFERSYLARDGARILCHFRAPDAESLRMALRVAGLDYDALWAGAVGSMSGAADFVLVVERVFEHSLSTEQERACRAWMARRLLDLGAEPARVLLSRCRKRVLWLCRAKTAATVTAAELQLAEHGFEVWGCKAGLPRSHAPNSTLDSTLGTTGLPQS